MFNNAALLSFICISLRLTHWLLECLNAFLNIHSKNTSSANSFITNVRKTQILDLNVICCRTLKSSKCDSKLTPVDELCKSEVMKFFLSFPGRSSLSKQQRHHKTYRISLLRKFLIQNSQIKQFGKKISPKCNGAPRIAYYIKPPASRFVCQHVVWLGTQPLEKKKKTQNTCTNHAIKLFWHLFTTSLLVLLSGYYVW